MSWSITLIGKPENVSVALDEYASRMTDGQSKIEFESALPHMKGIVNENFGQYPPLIKLSASGYGYSENGEQKQRQLAVSVELIYDALV